jgi:hypothetical protein
VGDFGAQQSDELGQPCRMRWPGWSSDKLAISNSNVYCDFSEFGTRKLHFGSTGRISADGLAFDDSRHCGKNLGTVANGSNWFAGISEFFGDSHDAGIESQVLGATTAWNQ